jgi:hypothetical protein
MVEQDIAELEITVGDTLSMKIFQSLGDLVCDSSQLSFGQGAFESFCEFTSLAVVSEDVMVVRVLNVID